MNPLWIRTGLLLLLALASAGACSLQNTPSTPVPTSTPTLTLTPTLDPDLPLSGQVTLQSVHYEESGDSPKYSISAEIPSLGDVDDPRVQAFNALAKSVVDTAIENFKESLKYAPVEPVTDGSSYDVRYNRISPPGDILSLILVMHDQEDGAVHSYQLTRSLNFDLEQGQEITLDMLFEPGSDYLGYISDYCKAELATRPIGFSLASTGADPLPENYHTWNLSAQNLVITFDEDQVANYTEGLQTVSIPYANLQAILNPQGPLARLIP